MLEQIATATGAFASAFVSAIQGLANAFATITESGTVQPTILGYFAMWGVGLGLFGVAVSFIRRLIKLK